MPRAIRPPRVRVIQISPGLLTRVVPPMPVDVLYCVPETATLGPLEMGALLALCRAFWLSGGRDLPADDTSLMRLAGCHARSWFAIRSAVKQALNSLMPVLTSVYAQTANLAAKRRFIAKQGNLASQLKAAQQAAQQAASGQGPAKLVDGQAQRAVLITQRKQQASLRYTIDGEVIPAVVIRGVKAGLVDHVVNRVIMSPQ